jgi:hypothetical protein
MDPKTGLRTEDEAVGKKIASGSRMTSARRSSRNTAREDLDRERLAKGLGCPRSKRRCSKRSSGAMKPGNKLKTVYGRLTAPTKEMTPEGRPPRRRRPSHGARGAATYAHPACGWCCRNPECAAVTRAGGAADAVADEEPQRSLEALEVGSGDPRQRPGQATQRHERSDGTRGSAQAH